MSRTEAQAAASRANGIKSKGPVTEEGKAISRRNSHKHGMAGEGVVLSTEEIVEVERRTAAMLSEMRPSTEMGQYLVGRLARLTVRVETCSKQELAANAFRAEHAADQFDEARIAEVDQALANLAIEPATLARKLRAMPEGIDRLIASLLDLQDSLIAGRWDAGLGEKLSHLMGDRWTDAPISRVRALSEAITGNFAFLRADDGSELSISDRPDWARKALAALIEEEFENLLRHRETIDFESIDRDRSSAADRLGFDPSQEATLARRYEAATERGVYRALREFREVEAEPKAVEPIPAPPEVVPKPVQPAPSGSFRAEIPMVARPAPTLASAPGSSHDRPIERTNEGPQSVGMHVSAFGRL